MFFLQLSDCILPGNNRLIFDHFCVIFFSVYKAESQDQDPLNI